MRYFLDTEFDENGETIMPISLALVRDDGRFLYMEFPFDWGRAQQNAFVAEHVLPTILRGADRGNMVLCLEGNADEDLVDVVQRNGALWLVKATAKSRLERFIDQEDPEFWAYYADYDWVLLCRLFGKMVDLPDHFPKLCMDLEQWHRQLGRPDGVKPSKPPGEHNALVDARWDRTFHANLTHHMEELMGRAHAQAAREALAARLTSRDSGAGGPISDKPV